eukprot:596971-Hanusia_phi.AAC.2
MCRGGWGPGVRNQRGARRLALLLRPPGTDAAARALMPRVPGPGPARLRGWAPPRRGGPPEPRSLTNGAAGWQWVGMSLVAETVRVI